MHRKITQCKLHASIRPYVHNKYFIWLAPILFSILIPGQEFLKELGTQFFRAISFSTPCKGSIVKKLKFARLPSVLDPIVMECSEFCAFFSAFSQSPTIRFLPQRIAGSGYEVGLCVNMKNTIYFLSVQTIKSKLFHSSGSFYFFM